MFKNKLPIFLYVLAYGFMCLNPGVFWDDWIIIHQSLENQVFDTLQMGIPWLGYFNYFLSWGGSSALVARIAVFAFFLIALLFQDKILRHFSVPLFYRVIWLSVAAVYPINLARVAICTAFYSAAYMVFWVSFWLALKLSKFEGVRKWLLKLVLFILFFWTFFIGSFLIYFGVVLVALGYDKWQKYKGFDFDKIQFLKQYVFDYWDLALWPVLFYALKKYFFKPFGLYATYNIPSLSYLAKSPYLFLSSFRPSLTEVFANSLLLIQGMTWLFVVVLACFIFWNLKKIADQDKVSQIKRTGIFFVGLGIFMIYLGYTSYLCVEKYFMQSGWEDRFGLLFSVGFGAICVGVVHFFMLQKFWVKQFGFVFISLALAFFTVSTFQWNLLFIKSFFKKEALIERVRVNPLIRDNTTFMVIDEGRHWNPYSQGYSFYEINAMFIHAFGTDNRFGMDSTRNDLQGHSSMSFFKPFIKNPVYSMSSWVPQEKLDATIKIKPLSSMPGFLDTLRLLALHTINREKFKSEVQSLFLVLCEKN